VAGGPSLVEQVLSGQSRELQILAAQGILPLAADELIPLQVELTHSENPEISGFAKQTLTELDPRLAAAFATAGASPIVLEYFASELDHPLVIDAVLRRRDTPRGILVLLAARISPDLQETLLLRQDAIIEEPTILDSLESNPGISLYSKRRIAEYREHLLPRRRRVDEEEENRALEMLPVGELDAADIAEIERVRQLPATGERDESTGLSESQVRSLTVPVRIKLGRGASRTLRTILLRDTNQTVALSALFGAALSEDEVEQIAASRSVVDEVLAEIARRRDWVNKYKICLALVKNPRVPVGTSVRLLSRLGVRDLRSLSRDRNVADAVRSGADRLYKIKTK
jgi:hypothetical protein